MGINTVKMFVAKCNGCGKELESGDGPVVAWERDGMIQLLEDEGWLQKDHSVVQSALAWNAKIKTQPMSKVTIAKNLSFPLEVVTQSIGILAKRRAGKSFLAKKLTEQLHKAGQQVCIIDPKGDWWGIRYARDGKGPGQPIFIFGGERGDIPLEVNGGSIVASLLVEQNVSVLLDLSHFRKREVAQFMTQFLEDLYRLKAKDKYRTPLMLMVDEADAIAPQRPQPEEARMLGAIEDIVRRGGQRGIGCCMITQRSAVLNKNVLTQIQVLICLRTIAPQDLKAMEEWINVYGDEERKGLFLQSLPSLPIGDAWVWSPGWPTNTEDGIFKRIHVDPIETFDSGASPKPGQKKVIPKGIAQVDLDLLRGQMAATIEEVKANDPKELKRRIADLEKEIKKFATVSGKSVVEVREIIKNVLEPKLVARLEKTYADMQSANEKHVALMSKYWGNAKESNDALLKAFKSLSPVVQPQPKAIVKHRPQPVDTLEEQNLYKKKHQSLTVPSPIGKAERKILTALAQYPEGKDKSQLALYTGYSPTGGFMNSIYALRSSRFITGEGSGNFKITDDGLRVLGDYDSLPTGKDLLDHWLTNKKIGKCEKAILQRLYDIYPADADKADLANDVGYSNTGGFANSIYKLRGLGLIEGKGEFKASKSFF